MTPPERIYNHIDWIECVIENLRDKTHDAIYREQIIYFEGRLDGIRFVEDILIKRILKN